MNGHRKYGIYSRFMGSIITLMVLFLTVACGCRRIVDPHLATVDSIMEEHPDSALMILENDDTTRYASDYNKAFYGLLLTHARYKNFIDETNDSLINASAEYFLDNGYKKEAARSLYLKGMINLNANKLEEAAVTFSHGLDIAQEEKYYLWEGMNAYGLYTLYDKLFDGSSQVYYGKQAYEAFLASGDKGWELYSKIVLARAYNNNCQYEKSISLMADLISDKETSEDSILLSEALQLRGMSLFALGKYDESIESYTNAHKMNNSILNDNDRYNIQMAFHELDQDSLYKIVFGLPQKSTNGNDKSKDAFVVLAEEGNYKEAYESLERYATSQDSLFFMLFKNNVSESVANYEGMKNTLKKEKVRNERMAYWIIFMGFAIICIVIFWRLREHVHREHSIRLKAEADIQSLKSDFLSQLENAKTVVPISSNKESLQKRDEFINVIRQRYSEANALCDDYYQGRYSKEKNECVVNNILKIVRSFTEKSSLEKIGEYVDENSNGLYTSFTKDFFDITEENRRLFLYLMLGLNSRTISVIIGQDISAVYNKKSRLKARIAKSDVLKKEDYLRLF